MTSLNSIRRIFLFILFSSIVTGTIMIYVQWENIKKEITGDLISTNNIMTSSIQSVLHKNEALLNILGKHLVELGVLQHPDSSAQKLIDELLDNNPDLAGIGLANLSGQLVLTSLNIERSALPNLRNTPETSDTFNEALKTKKMIIGRTYYMKALKQWLIPLRYRISNDEGKVMAVMTTGLKLNDKQNLWSNKNIPDYMQVLIVRKDLYRQYIDDAYSDNMGIKYSEPTPLSWVNLFEKNLIEQVGMDLAELRSSGKTISLISSYGDKRTSVISAISYDHSYQHYTIIATPLSYLYSRLLKPVAWMLTLLVFFNVTLYFILRSNLRLQRKSKQHLKYQSTHDQLTDLPNRRYLLNQFSLWQNKNQGYFSILFIDLDNFKSINDSHGHSVGDIILRDVAVRINHVFQQSLNIRQGGDEFIILHREVNQENLTNLVQQFLQHLKQPLIINNLEFFMSASVGISFAPEHGDDIDTLLRKADMAMYEAKRKQSAIYVFSQKLEEQQNRKVSIENELIHALERNEFSLVYQPQINAGTQSLAGVEALLRWQNPLLGKVSPTEFIPVAESTGLIIDIGLYVLKTALSEIADARKLINHSENIRVSVNVSVYQLLNDNFLDKILSIKNKQEYTHIDLVIEVTENLFIEDLDAAKSILERMQLAGMEVSLDDFGTGYSSLSVLSKLPVNELKIDKSFVDDIIQDEQNRLLILSIISLGKSLAIPVVAEGVEDREQADFLAEHGCDIFQGYYFSRPLAKEQLMAYIHSGV